MSHIRICVTQKFNLHVLACAFSAHLHKYSIKSRLTASFSHINNANWLQWYSFNDVLISLPTTSLVAYKSGNSATLRENTGSISSGIILGMGSANERWRYIVTSFLIGWAHTQNDPWLPGKSGTFVFCFVLRDHSMYAPSQWGMLHCNITL